MPYFDLIKHGDESNPQNVRATPYQRLRTDVLLQNLVKQFPPQMVAKLFCLIISITKSFQKIVYPNEEPAKPIPQPINNAQQTPFSNIFIGGNPASVNAQQQSLANAPTPPATSANPASILAALDPLGNSNISLPTGSLASMPENLRSDPNSEAGTPMDISNPASVGKPSKRNKK